MLIAPLLVASSVTNGSRAARLRMSRLTLATPAMSFALSTVAAPVPSEIADFWRAQGKPEYVDAVTEEPEDGGGLSFEDEFTASDNPWSDLCFLTIYDFANLRFGGTF